MNIKNPQLSNPISYYIMTFHFNKLSTFKILINISLLNQLILLLNIVCKYKGFLFISYYNQTHIIFEKEIAMNFTFKIYFLEYFEVFCRYN